MSAKAVWIAFGIGVTAGAAIALLYAPQSGKGTRKKIGKVYDNATDYLEDAGDYLKDQADRLAKQSKKAYAKGADAASDAYNSAADAASDAYSKSSDRLADAFSTAKGAVDTAKDKASDFGSYTAAYGKKIRSMV